MWTTPEKLTKRRETLGNANQNKTTRKTEYKKVYAPPPPPPPNKGSISELKEIYEKQHSENTDKWHHCKAGSFSYGESPLTPPLERTSLHRWNNDVERPLGILSLFTTCLWQVKSHCHLLPHLQNMPPKEVEKKEDLQNAEKKKLVLLLGYLHSVNHTRSPQDDSYIHSYFIPGRNNHLNTSLFFFLFF